jgi:hypothetical protein
VLSPDLFLKSSGTGPRLRIGILLDGFVLPRFCQEVISHIQRCNFASIELIVVNQASASAVPARPPSKWRSLISLLKDSKRRSWLGYILYQKFDARYYPQENDPLASADCSEQLANIDILRVTPIAKGFVHRVAPDDVARIRGYNLDVTLRFGFNILKGEILTSARYGIWSYHHSDNEYYRGGPPQFWELVEDNELTGVILQILTEELDAGKVLAKALFSTSQGLSVRRNRYDPYWGSVALVIQKLYELHSYGWDHVLQRSLPDKPYLGRRKLYRIPTNGELCGWFLRSVAKIVWRRIKRVTQGERGWAWRIAIREQPDLLPLRSHFEPQTSFHWLIPPRGHFHSDPFLFSHNDKMWMFFEDYVYLKKKAVICCREVAANGGLGDICTVVDRPYPLSYPFVFQHDHHTYMIPESHENGTIELYRADDFPYRWSLERTLFHAKAVDTTLLIENGFWFFTTIFAPFGEGHCLCLFFSDSLTGEWHPHPCNPISMDVRDARSGGRVSRRGGKLYRISQSGAGHYGSSSFSLHEVLALTRSDYKEVLVETIRPWPPYFGVHSYDRCGQFEVIDGLTRAASADLFVAAEFPRAQPAVPKDSRDE